MKNLKFKAPRKRIYYWIFLPSSHWWVHGYRLPLTNKEFEAQRGPNEKGAANSRMFRTMKQVRRLLDNLPIGAIINRDLHCRRGKFELRSWEKFK